MKIVKVILSSIFIFSSYVSLAHAVEPYHSKDDGFEVSFPAEPDINKVENDLFNLKDYQAHSLDGGYVTQYNVFFYSLKNGKIFDDAAMDAYFKNVPGSDGILIKQEEITYKGFKGTEYKVKVHHNDIDWIRKGLTFFVDGDPIKISVLEPASINESQSHYPAFKDTFQLQAIDTPVNDVKWSNDKIAFNPPSGWQERKDKIQGHVIAVFSNDSGIALELMQAPTNEASCKSMRGFVKLDDIDENNFFKTEFEIPEYHVTMKTLSACIEKAGFTYVLSGKAPKETFFRWSLIFQKSLKSLG